MDFSKLAAYKKDYISIIVLLSLFIFCAIFFGHVYGTPYIDNGREAWMPSAMLQGYIPFKDIFAMYNPLSYQINMCLYWLLGDSIDVLYIAGYINAFMVVLGTYFICRIFINEYYSFVLPFMIMCIYIFKFTGHSGYIFPYAYAMVYAVCSFIYAVLFFLLFAKNKKIIYAYISCLLLGISLANKPEFSLCIIPIIAYMVINKIRIYKILIAILLYILPLLFSWGILFLSGFNFTDFINYLHFIKNFFNTDEQIYYTVNYIHKRFTLDNIWFCFYNFCSFLLLIVVSSIYLLYKFKRTKLFFFLILPLYVFFLYKFYPTFTVNNYFSWTIILSFILCLYCLKTKKNETFFWLSLIAVISCYRVGLIGSNLKYYILPLIFIWIFFVKFRFERIKFNYVKYTSFSIILLLIFSIYTIKNNTSTYMIFNTQKGTFGYKKKQMKPFKEIVKWVEENTEKDDSILVMPEGVMVNFVTNRQTKPLYYHLIPNHVSALGEDNVIAGLNADKPDYIIVLTYPGNKAYGKGPMCEDWGEKICLFIDNNYALEKLDKSIILNKKEVLFYKQKE